MTRTLLLVTAVLLLIGGGVYLFSRSGPQPATALDGFAQCLAQKQVTMYGADWCPHCQNEKGQFGTAFQYVPYVECPADPKRCLDLNVEKYPTWIFPTSPAGGSDGRRLVGEQGLRKLAEASGCALPQ